MEEVNHFWTRDEVPRGMDVVVQIFSEVLWDAQGWMLPCKYFGGCYGVYGF